MRIGPRAILAALVLGLLTAAPHAAATTSTLVVDGTVLTDPSGCVFLGANAAHRIENKTDGVVTLYPDADCKGDSAGILAPGDYGSYLARSAKVS